MAIDRARLYDILYRAAKDYETEAAKLEAVVRARRATAATLLDVACGTGEHARHLSRRGFRVDGVDKQRSHVALARRKNPAGSFHVGDMRDFDLGRQYDVVVCLFGSIGYARDRAGLGRAVRAMARHVAREGLLLVEPWFEPGQLQDGRVMTLTAEQDGVTISRMSHLEIEGRVSRLRFEYLIGDATGLRRSREHHELGLFTRTEMETAFQAAGLRVELDPEGLASRALYVASVG
ncbi:MAG TPA: class I SAM-dependent methyltransferase [Vicinamibacterales bacterium]|nr:class I SAM-dependent methyltransferase [Vicinamibacterales bacterium]